MKVRDLIAQLNKLDPELEIYAYCEDAGQSSPELPYGVFDLQHVNFQCVKLTRGHDGKPAVHFQNEDGAWPAAFIQITQEF